MKAAQDLFSKQATTYRKYRPTYPAELYDLLLSYTQGRDACWDVGTGNGQVAAVLATHFKEVYATDLSTRQLENAIQRPNIHYSASRAETPDFADGSFDLVTVGQAMHWFDHTAFNAEVNRVLKPGGVIAIWCYELSRVSPEIDAIIWQFYTEVIGRYWSEERRFIDEHYVTIPFDFEEVSTPDDLQMKVSWDLSMMEGYLNSWSAVQKYISENGRNPVDELTRSLAPVWGQTLDVVFPLYLRVGKPIK